MRAWLHRPGELVAPVKRPRLRHSSVGAAPASERAQLPAERSEERRLPLVVQRVCGVKGVWGHHCDSSIVWGGRWAQPLGRPCLRLNAKPSVARHGIFLHETES